MPGRMCRETFIRLCRTSESHSNEITTIEGVWKWNHDYEQYWGVGESYRGGGKSQGQKCERMGKVNEKSGWLDVNFPKMGRNWVFLTKFWIWEGLFFLSKKSEKLNKNKKCQNCQIYMLVCGVVIVSTTMIFLNK